MDFSGSMLDGFFELLHMGRIPVERTE
jgi:hypothetical protein